MKLINFRTLGSFEQENTDRQVAQFEENVSDAFAAVQASFLQQLAPTSRKTASYTAQPGDMVIVDPTAGSVTITLPKSTPQNAGKPIAIARTSASNTVTAAASAGDSVNGATTNTLTAAIGMRLFWSSGAGWYA